MDFQSYQRAFTARIRDPEGAPRPPGAPARRMKVYETLLFNNVEGFLLACFPVCRRILGARRWKTLVRAFFREHAAHSPYFRQIPEEFLRYVQETGLPDETWPAFLPELAHYESVELALDTAEADLPDVDADADLLEGAPALNPVLRLLAYRWPVHRLSPRFKPAEPPPEPTFIVAYRDADFTVRFQALNAVSARLLQILQEAPALSGARALRQLAAQRGETDAAAFVRFGARQLEAWRAEGLLLGVRRAA